MCVVGNYLVCPNSGCDGTSRRDDECLLQPLVSLTQPVPSTTFYPLQRQRKGDERNDKVSTDFEYCGFVITFAYTIKQDIDDT